MELPEPFVAYRTVDVFSRTRFGGNPLAVVPDARGLTTAQMQRIANEFGYSETTFVLPPGDPAHTARVRIFTPVQELPFAGHPNVGTAYVLARQGDAFGASVGSEMRFEEDAGVVDVRVTRSGEDVAGAMITAPRALDILNDVDPSVVAACASLDEEDVAISRHAPTTASVGVPFVLSELTDLGALARATPDRAAFARAAAAQPARELDLALFLYVRTADAPLRLRARMFAPLTGVAEDPATGSAAAALGAYLYARAPEHDLGGTIAIEQGAEMGRPSLIEVQVDKAHGEVRRVAVGGACADAMEGVLRLGG